MLDIKTVENEIGRFYYTDQFFYPSITTILSYDNEHINQWRKNVGEEKANLIMKNACERGSSIHEMVEVYLKYNVINKSHVLLYNMFLPIKRWLDANISEIISIESILISHKLKVAGRVDLIIKDKNDQKRIIDFKTTSKPKTENLIKNYKEQVSAYAVAFYEMSGIEIQNYNIIMVTEDGMLQKFEGNDINKHIISFYEKRKKFKYAYNI